MARLPSVSLLALANADESALGRCAALLRECAASLPPPSGFFRNAFLISCIRPNPPADEVEAGALDSSGAVPPDIDDVRAAMVVEEMRVLVLPNTLLREERLSLSLSRARASCRSRTRAAGELRREELGNGDLSSLLTSVDESVGLAVRCTVTVCGASAQHQT